MNPHGSARSFSNGQRYDCWNCHGDHPLGKCDKPKDQARIEANKKKWEQDKKDRGEWKSRSNGDSGGGGGRKGKGGKVNSAASGVKYSNGQWLMKCSKTNGNGKTCGWNHTHSTRFHGAWMQAPQCYPTNLPNTHPIWAKMSKPNGGTAPPPPTLPAGGSNGGMAGAAVGGGDGLVKQLASRTQAVFAEMAKTVSDPDVASAFEKLDKVWTLN